MATITYSHVYKLIDKAVAVYNLLKGDGTYGLGDGTDAASLKAVDINNLVSGAADSSFADSSLQTLMSQPASLLSGRLEASVVWGSQFSNMLGAMSVCCSLARTVSSTINDLDSFMLWYNRVNAVTFNQCLAPPEWREMYYACRARYPDPLNLYFPTVQGSTVLGNTMTNGLYKQVIGTGDTAGFVVDFTEFAGGEAYITWSGGAGAGAVSIAVTGLNQNGASSTWSASGTWGVGSYVATNTGIALTPATTGDLITKATALVITGMSAGTVYVEGRAPSGRTWPPT